jgi:hypothetical protein
MATVKQYIIQMRNRQKTIATKLGADITRADKQTRVLNQSLLALLAVVIKTLTDKGVINDAELIATMNAAEADAYDDEPMEPPSL